jgi:hypothetical protein
MKPLIRVCNFCAVLGLLFVFLGCTNAKWPSFKLSQSDGLQASVAQSLAADLVARIASDVPAASTVLTVSGGVSEFDRALVGYLRLAGFGVHECADSPQLTCGTSQPPLSATVTGIGEDSFFVTAILNRTTWQRAYVLTPDGVHFASFWSRVTTAASEGSG